MAEKNQVEKPEDQNTDLEVEDLEDVSGGGIWSCGNGNCGCNPEEDSEIQQ